MASDVWRDTDLWTIMENSTVPHGVPRLNDKNLSTHTKPGDESYEALRLVIIGAGLAGLGTAISTKLANPDVEVIILEAVKELADVGVGLIIVHPIIPF